MSSINQHAGCWFLRSGIQEPHGGVARYFLTESGRNLSVSSEITGYAVSTLVYLHSLTGQTAYLDSALRAARFLTEQAWDPDSSTFPFEPGSDRAYFFDVGIIVRGLLAAWRASGEEENELPWPTGYRHYVANHEVRPSFAFEQFIAIKGARFDGCG